MHPVAGLSVVVLLLWLGAAGAAARSPSSTPTGVWTVVGGPVDAVARAGGSVYLGGAFQGLARRAPAIAAFDPASGDLLAPAAQLEQLASAPLRVTATTAAADGGVYVAGVFAGAGSARQQRLLRFNAAGALDGAFKPDVQGATEISDMDVGPDGVLYLAGGLTTVGGQPRTTLAAVDATTGALKAWSPATTGSVAQVEAGPDAVYIGGSFSAVAGVARSRIAAVGLDGAVLPWNPQANDAVQTLALTGTTLYAGGDFTKIGTTDRLRLAALDTATGALASWNPAPSGAVTRIVAAGSAVYVAGTFTRIGAQATQPTRNFLAALDATSGDATAWDPLASRAPADLALAGGRVYLAWRGGDLMPKLAGQARCGLASVDAQTGEPTAWDPRVEAAETTSGNCDPAQLYRSGSESLTIAGGRVWAGGSFGVANVLRRAGLAALDAASGAPLAWAPAIGDPFSESVQDLLPSADGTTIYVGGRFGRINGLTRRNAAAIASAGAADGAADVRSWNPGPDNSGGTGVVRALALSPDGHLVFLGGSFTTAGSPGRARINLAAVGAASAAAEAWRPNPSGGAVRALLVDAATDRLFVGGEFREITASSTDVNTPDRVARAGLAAVDIGPAVDDPVVTPWDAGLVLEPGGGVEALALRGSELVAGGVFATAGDGPANLASFDPATAAPTSWRPQVDRRVSTVTIDPLDGSAYVTGAFTSAGGEPRAGAAAVGADGSATGWDPAPAEPYPGTDLVSGPPGGVLLLDDDRLLLTGLFTALGTRRQGAIAIFGAATAAIAVAPPRIAGTARISDPPLRCDAATWAGDRGTLTIAWLRDDVEIPAQSGRAYTLVPADRGHLLRCRETMSNAAASVQQLSAPTAAVVGLPPAPESPPAVGGQPWAGGIARCTTGLWRNAPTDYRYGWLLDGAPIDGASGASYAIAPADEQHELACDVTASNQDGSSAALRSAAVLVTEPPPLATGMPLISGDARVGGVLTCLPGPWERAGELSYQWLRDRLPVVEAVAATFGATSRDLGRALTCLVTARNAGGTASAESSPVVVIASAHSIGTGRRPNVADDAPAAAPPAGHARGVTLRTVRLRAGTLSVAVRAPSRGRISVMVVRGGAQAPVTRLLTRGTRSVRRATAATVRLRLSATARRRVAQAGRGGLRVSVRVTFTPAAARAAPSRAQQAATLRAPATRR